MTNKNPLVSVIILCYNQGEYLSECLDSVLSLTYENIHLIFIDHASTDNTWEIACQYKNSLENKFSEVEFVKLDNNVGVVNVLINHQHMFKGKYCKVLAADDIFLPNGITDLVDCMEQDDEIGMAYGDALIFCDENSSNDHTYLKDGSYTKDYFILPDEDREAFILDLCGTARVSILATLHRTSCFNEIGGYDKDFLYEDWPLIMKMALNYKCKYIGKVTNKYRVHFGSLSSTSGNGIIMAEQVHRRWLYEPLRKRIGTSFKYVIWGASGGGEYAKRIIGDFFPEAELVGVIDEFKKGCFQGVSIVEFSQFEKSDIDYDYMFIATRPGEEYAVNKLKSIGKKNVYDYLCI